MNKLDFAKQLQCRTKNLAMEIIKLGRLIPVSTESKVIHYQLIKAGTSIAANYRAVCRSRSHKEFISKLGIVIEETDEVLYWLELIKELHLLNLKKIEPVYKEAKELLAIFIKSRITAKSNKS
jgi:four helix bundle protein